MQPETFTFDSAPPASEGDRDYIPMARCKGRLLIVRPLEYQQGFVTQHRPEGTDVVFADIACLDPIPAAYDEYGEELKGFPPGTQFRNQAVLQGFLKGTFKRRIGGMLLGTIYFGPRTKGKPPMMWQDLTGDQQCVARAQQFLVAHREFLIPVEVQFEQSPGAVPEVMDQRPPTYGSNSRPGPDSVYQQHEPRRPIPQPYQQPEAYSAPVGQQSSLEQMRLLAASGQQEAAPF